MRDKKYGKVKASLPLTDIQYRRDEKIRGQEEGCFGFDQNANTRTLSSIFDFGYNSTIRQTLPGRIFMSCHTKVTKGID
jgi:hypothetical protein